VLPVQIDDIALEGGSFGTFNQTAKISGSEDWLSYFFGFGHFSSEDTPVTPANLVPPGRAINPSAYDNRTLSLRLGAAIGDQFDVGLTSQYIQSTLFSTSDDFLGPETSLTRNGNNEFFTRGFAHMTLFDGRFDQTLGLAYTNYQRSVIDPNTVPIIPSLFEGQRAKLDYQGNLRLIEGDELYDNFPAFGFVANPNLKPETSIGFDGGIEQTLLPGRISVGATYFANKITNLIDCNDTFTSYVNIGEARTFGLESFMSLTPWDGFSVRADYTYTVAKDELTQLDLLRRPRDKFSISATLQATPTLLLSATFVYTGPW
jgi:TonB dependent receptor